MASRVPGMQWLSPAGCCVPWEGGMGATLVRLSVEACVVRSREELPEVLAPLGWFNALESLTLVFGGNGLKRYHVD